MSFVKTFLLHSGYKTGVQSLDNCTSTIPSFVFNWPFSQPCKAQTYRARI